MTTYTIYAKQSCRGCRGRGYVTDYVPWGSTSVPMDTECDCAFDDLPEDFDDEKDDYIIEATNDDYGAGGIKLKKNSVYEDHADLYDD